MKGSFVPGFGVKIGDAVQASCSAYPYFNRKTVVTSTGDNVELIDGGFCANNPTLYAIADATVAMQITSVVRIGGTTPCPSEVGTVRLVDAPLPGLDQGELVTIPLLPDSSRWHTSTAARPAKEPKLSLQKAAQHYR